MENLFNKPTKLGSEEFFETLLDRPGVRIERIVSTGQTTPAGEWYDQVEDEWVALLTGSAKIQFQGEPASIQLHPGDYLLIPANKRHRVEWTSTEENTVWLAVFLPSLKP